MKDESNSHNWNHWDNQLFHCSYKILEIPKDKHRDRERSQIVSASQCVQLSGLDHSASLDFSWGWPPNTDHTHTTVSTLCLPAAAPQIKTERRQCTRGGWRDWQKMGCRCGVGSAYAHSDTFSLFLFSRPVLIISNLGHWGPPNIELLLIDQACINKPGQSWQHVSRGRGQIGGTDYLYYQGQASLGALGWVCDSVCVSYFFTIQNQKYVCAKLLLSYPAPVLCPISTRHCSRY